MGERYKKCLGSAIIKIKFIKSKMNVEDELFSDIISSNNCCIRVDFSNGVSLFEERFKRIDSTIYKFYVDFYDDYKGVDFIDYLTSSNSDYRVTTEDGVIIRMCSNDYNLIKDEENDTAKKKYNVNILKEFSRMFVWK